MILFASLGAVDNIPEENSEDYHVVFESVDGLLASIPLRKAMSLHGDVLLAYEMNGQQLPAEHGFPLRVVVPGHVGVRNVKWVQRIWLSREEAEGAWQRGIAYKGFGPSVLSTTGINVPRIHSLQEMPVQSAITSLTPGSTLSSGKQLVQGYAYSGGGRGIVRVDVSSDGGATWKTANLGDGAYQKTDKAWAWTFWDCDIEIPEGVEKVEVICKAVDSSYNVQPDTVQGVWNLRGINNNAWHRVECHVKN